MTNTPAKDVIYIDTDDDITSIIGKVKDAKSKIVALVPPKRVGVLQSAVNLRLLQKASTGADKRVVLITNNHSLTALAAGVKMPVAKNLQSKPEIAKIDALEVDDEDVINGEEMPVGDLAKTAGASKSDSDKEGISSAAKEASASLGAAATAGSASKEDEATKSSLGKKLGGKKMGVPNFDTFRKRLFLIVGGAVLLIGFLVWALAFAPKATVTISAKTSPVPINQHVVLDPGKDADIEEARLKPMVEQVKKTRDVQFNATGEKEVGDKATGSITVTNCEYPDGFTIPSGTTFRAGSGLEFVSTQSASLPGWDSFSECDEATRSIAVEAETFGPEYNIGATSYAISGIGGNIDAEGGQMSGGTRETVKVVSEDDVEKAKEELKEANTASVREELSGQFEGDIIIIQESFDAKVGDPNVSPAVGERANTASLTVETTYRLLALPREQVKSLLDLRLNESIEGQERRSIYSSGDKEVAFSQFQGASGGTYTTTVNTTGFIGPSIDDAALAEELVGKNFGEIEQTVNTIEGVDGVEVDFWPFWVNTAPSTDKITIKFSVLNDPESEQ